MDVAEWRRKMEILHIRLWMKGDSDGSKLITKCMQMEERDIKSNIAIENRHNGMPVPLLKVLEQVGKSV